MSTSCIYGPRLFYLRPFRANDAVEAVIKVRDWSHLTAPMSALRLNIHKIGQDTNTFKFYDSQVEIKTPRKSHRGPRQKWNCHTQKMIKNQFLFTLKLEKSTYKFSASRKGQPAFPLSILALSIVRFKGSFLTTSNALNVKRKSSPCLLNVICSLQWVVHCTSWDLWVYKKI